MRTGATVWKAVDNPSLASCHIRSLDDISIPAGVFAAVVVVVAAASVAAAYAAAAVGIAAYTCSGASFRTDMFIPGCGVKKRVQVEGMCASLVVICGAKSAGPWGPNVVERKSLKTVKAHKHNLLEL